MYVQPARQVHWLACPTLMHGNSGEECSVLLKRVPHRRYSVAAITGADDCEGVLAAAVALADKARSLQAHRAAV